MSSGSERPRQPYQKSARRQRLAQLLLDAGREILLDEGLGLGATDLTFKRVLDHIEKNQDIRISPGSVYDRLWVDVRDYQLEVLALAASGTRYQNDEWAELEATIGYVLEHSDLTTEWGRGRFVKEVTRVAGKTNADQIATSPDWILWTAIWALYLLAGDPNAIPGAEAIGNSLAESFTRSLERDEDLYRGLVPVAGLKANTDLIPDDDTAITLYATLVNSLAEGLAFRRRHVGDEQSTIELPTGDNGENEPWDLFGFGAYILARGIFCHEESSHFLHGATL